MAAPLIIAGAGAAFQAYGAIKSGYDQAKADEQNAAMKREQADELIAREAINEKIMSDQASYQSHDYMAAVATTGGEGAGIGGKLRIFSDLQKSIANSQRDAQFKASLLRQGADQDMSLASDAVTSGYIKGFGSLLSSAGSVYSAYDKYKSPSSDTQNLPGVSP